MTKKDRAAIVRRCKAWDRFGARFGWVAYGYNATPDGAEDCTFYIRKPHPKFHTPSFTLPKEARYAIENALKESEEAVSVLLRPQPRRFTP